MLMGRERPTAHFEVLKKKKKVWVNRRKNKWTETIKVVGSLGVALRTVLPTFCRFEKFHNKILCELRC